MENDNNIAVPHRSRSSPTGINKRSRTRSAIFTRDHRKNTLMPNQNLSYISVTPRKQSVHSSQMNANNEKFEVIHKATQLRKELIAENQGWNSDLEAIVKDIGEDAYAMSDMHAVAAAHFNKLYQWIGIIAILITLGAATGSVTQISCSQDLNVVTLLVSILLYITSVVEAIKQFKNWGARFQNHIQSQVNFSSTYKNIRIMLGSYRRDRPTGKDYAEWVAKNFDDLNLSSPLIPGWIQAQYTEKIKNIDISNPNVPQPIVVKTNPTPPDKDSFEDSREELVEVVVDDKGKEEENDRPPIDRRVRGGLKESDLDEASVDLPESPSLKKTTPRRKSYSEIDEEVCEIKTGENDDIVINFKPFSDVRGAYAMERFFENQ